MQPLAVMPSTQVQNTTQNLVVMRVNGILIGVDADPDIPICKQAKAEYAKLQ